MNNAKMWLVVPPAVGVPVFLGAVAVGSFAVHVAVLSNTSWVSDFLSGQELGSGDQQEAMLIDEGAASVAKASYAMPSPDGGQRLLVMMPDGSVRTATLDAAAPMKVSQPAVIEQ
ncbi:light-harvesting protein [uncultured Roseobacter sp.]|uniref:light-harvesting protein n=1 Tax=uncultured Roseobacter sp. TaxID=114847 RepID=UPI00260F601B|nr:light-harvesting protein [uncultured Roseobacter sp.]